MKQIVRSVTVLLVSAAFAIGMVYGLTSPKARSVQLSKPVAAIILTLVFAQFVTSRE